MNNALFHYIHKDIVDMFVTLFSKILRSVKSKASAELLKTVRTGVFFHK